ncbi:hypothetical protein HDV00_005889 [Rhizophlyctis rosea]|nr:hypothetical protein HDV00_005889 [Rhizophlyctis rosea]
MCVKNTSNPPTRLPRSHHPTLCDDLLHIILDDFLARFVTSPTDPILLALLTASKQFNVILQSLSQFTTLKRKGERHRLSSTSFDFQKHCLFHVDDWRPYRCYDGGRGYDVVGAAALFPHWAYKEMRVVEADPPPVPPPPTIPPAPPPLTSGWSTIAAKPPTKPPHPTTKPTTPLPCDRFDIPAPIHTTTPHIPASKITIALHRSIGCSCFDPVGPDRHPLSWTYSTFSPPNPRPHYQRYFTPSEWLWHGTAEEFYNLAGRMMKDVNAVPEGLWEVERLGEVCKVYRRWFEDGCMMPPLSREVYSKNFGQADIGDDFAYDEEPLWVATKGDRFFYV